MYKYFTIFNNDLMSIVRASKNNLQHSGWLSELEQNGVNMDDMTLGVTRLPLVEACIITINKKFFNNLVSDEQRSERMFSLLNDSLLEVMEDINKLKYDLHDEGYTLLMYINNCDKTNELKLLILNGYHK